MSDFLTRMINRTLGLTEVIQPLIQPTFVQQGTGRGNVPVQRQHYSEESSEDAGSDAVINIHEYQQIELHSWDHSELNDHIQDETKSLIDESDDVKPKPLNKLLKRRREPLRGTIHPLASEPNDLISCGTENSADDFSRQSFDVSDNKMKKLPQKEYIDGGSQSIFKTLSSADDISGISAQEEGIKRDHIFTRDISDISNNLNLNKGGTREQSKRTDETALADKNNWNIMETEAPLSTYSSTQKDFEKKQLVSPRKIKNMTLPHESESPSIKVTIGRIEVRAVTQQLPMIKHSKPQKPGLSLEEYLKRRSGAQK